MRNTRLHRLLLPVTLVGALSTVVGLPSTATAAPSSITIWATAGANYDWQKVLIPGFEAATGIKVNYDILPETPLLDKEETAELAGSTAYSVMENSQSNSATFAAEHGAVALNSFIHNSKLTPASYDFNGMSRGLYGACEVNGKLYCLPMSGDGGPEIFWNKALFHAAGISQPPATWAQVVQDAQKINDPSKGISGFCTRGEEATNWYNFLLMFPYFAPYSPSNQGEFVTHNWKPLFNTPGALTWAKDYARLMQDYAPKGVANYGYAECEHAFETGQTAMYFDDAVFEFFFSNPKISKTANVTGYDELPCPAFNPTCLVALPWGMYVNPHLPTSQQTEAWKYLEYMTSPGNQIKAMVATLAPGIASRPASLTYALSHNSIFKAPADWLTAIHYDLGHIEGNAIPSTPALNPIEEHLGVMLSSLISGQSTPQQALSSIQSQTAAILAENHL